MSYGNTTVQGPPPAYTPAVTGMTDFERSAGNWGVITMDDWNCLPEEERINAESSIKLLKGGKGLQQLPEVLDKVTEKADKTSRFTSIRKFRPNFGIQNRLDRASAYMDEKWSNFKQNTCKPLKERALELLSDTWTFSKCLVATTSVGATLGGTAGAAFSIKVIPYAFPSIVLATGFGGAVAGAIYGVPIAKKAVKARRAQAAELKQKDQTIEKLKQEAKVDKGILALVEEEKTRVETTLRDKLRQYENQFGVLKEVFEAV